MSPGKGTVCRAGWGVGGELSSGSRFGAFADSGSVVSEGGFASINRIRAQSRAEKVVAEGTATLERVGHLDTYFKVTRRRKVECRSEEPAKTPG